MNSSTWDYDGNWSCGVVPDKYTEAIINYATPVIDKDTTVKSITINPSASLIVNPPAKLVITK